MHEYEWNAVLSIHTYAEKILFQAPHADVATLRAHIISFSYVQIIPKQETYIFRVILTTWILINYYSESQKFLIRIINAYFCKYRILSCTREDLFSILAWRFYPPTPT